jgi:hypothetical protein
VDQEVLCAGDLGNDELSIRVTEEPILMGRVERTRHRINAFFVDHEVAWELVMAALALALSQTCSGIAAYPRESGPF